MESLGRKKKKEKRFKIMNDDRYWYDEEVVTTYHSGFYSSMNGRKVRDVGIMEKFI